MGVPVNGPRNSLLFCLALVCFLFVGCAALDTAVGLDPETGERSPGNPADTAGGILGLIGGPWGTIASGLIGSAATIYASVRSRRWNRAGSSIARGVNVLRERAKTNTLAMDEKTLTEIFSAIQDEEGTRSAVRDLIRRL